jgi:hypothetical protein
MRHLREMRQTFEWRQVSAPTVRVPCKSAKKRRCRFLSILHDPLKRSPELAHHILSKALPPVLLDAPGHGQIAIASKPCFGSERQDLRTAASGIRPDGSQTLTGKMPKCFFGAFPTNRLSAADRARGLGAGDSAEVSEASGTETGN